MPLLRAGTRPPRNRLVRLALSIALAAWPLAAVWRIDRGVAGGGVIGPPFPLCVAGNAETADHAAKMAAFFPGAPAVWSVWGAGAAALPALDPAAVASAAAEGRPLLLLRPAPNSTWADGIEEGVALLRPLGCEYLALVDDDLVFELRGAQALPRAVGGEIMRLLRRYRPAALGFANVCDPARSVPAGTDVSIAGSFDEKVVLHASLVDYFFPLAPRGELNFTGRWTLPIRHMLATIPRMYRGHVLTAQHLRVINTITFSDSRNYTVVEDRLAFVPGSRHPFEFPVKERYNAFLCAALRRIPIPHDSDRDDPCVGAWAPAALAAELPTILPPPPDDAAAFYGDYLARLLPHLDPVHPAVATRPWIADRFPDPASLATLRAERANFTVTLVVLTCDRPASLERLVGSVLAADYASARGPVDLAFRVDHCPDHFPAVRAIVDRIKWPHGSVTAEFRTERAYLRRSVAEAWAPRSDDDFAVLLEDDVEVSPSFFAWAVAALMQYYYLAPIPLSESRVAAIALYAPRHSEAAGAPFAPPPGPAYAMQVPCSWGALFLPRAWRRFRTFFEAHSAHDPLVPHLSVSAWAPQRSWKKYHYRFLAEAGLAVVYPGAGNGSFSTNRVERGANMLDDATVQRVRALLDVPLAPAGWTVPAGGLPPWEALPKLDVYEAPVPPGTWPPRPPPWEALMRFAVVVHSRDPAALPAAASHWLEHPRVALVVARSIGNATACPSGSEGRCIAEPAGNIQALFRPPPVGPLHMFFADAAVRIPQADVDWAFYTQLRYPQRGVGFASCAAGFGWADGGPPRAWFPPTADKLPQGAVRVAASRAVFLPPHVLQEYWDEGFAEGRKVVEKEGGLDLLLLAARAARAARAGGDYTDLLVDGSVQGCTPSEDEGPAPKALLELLGKGKWTVRQAKGFPENWMAEWRGKERVPMVVVPPPGFGNVTSIAPVNSTHGP